VTKEPSTSQELEFVKCKAALLKRINRFRKVQRTYMPDLARFLTSAQHDIWNDKTRSAESIKLFLPSELSAESRARACEKGLDGIESEMQECELHNMLEELHQALRTRMATNRYRHRNLSGQQALTRGQGVLCQIQIRIHKGKLRYWYARNTFLRLKGHGPWERMYRVLGRQGRTRRQ
jgi:hypothetical protein